MMRRLRSSHLVLILAGAALLSSRCLADDTCCMQGSEDLYLATFDQIIEDSYSALTEAPNALLADCAAGGTTAPDAMTSWTLAAGAPSSSVGASCGASCVLTVAAGATLHMNASLNIGALVVEANGRVEWDDASQRDAADLWLCAGYVAVEGTFELNVTRSRAWIYVKNNGASHSYLGPRVVGAFGFGDVTARLDVAGRALRRTWSLLASPAAAGDGAIMLMHDATEMGWRVGDRIAIAPTTDGSAGRGETFHVRAIDGATVTLGDASGAAAVTAQAFAAEFKARNGLLALKTAEVLNLARSVVITGDDFEHVPCDESLDGDVFGESISASGCACTTYASGGHRSTCTIGLHTLAAFNAVYRVQNARLEKCGQRGIAARYCAHMHLAGDCPGCLVSGNAFEHSQQRGLVVHGTHRTTARENVFYDVRGAAIYVEDGNELFNSFEYNVGVCPWPLTDETKWGCTLPGTSNAQSDTSLNQAGLWSLSPTQIMIGNRFANSFNGMLFETNAFGANGRQYSEGQVCTAFLPIGRVEGNTFHGHGRFGTYILSSHWPHETNLTQLLAADGLMDDITCSGFTADGGDAGVPATLKYNVDYQNAFVGGYVVLVLYLPSAMGRRPLLVGTVKKVFRAPGTIWATSSSRATTPRTTIAAFTGRPPRTSPTAARHTSRAHTMQTRR